MLPGAKGWIATGQAGHCEPPGAHCPALSLAGRGGGGAAGASDCSLPEPGRSFRLLQPLALGESTASRFSKFSDEDKNHSFLGRGAKKGAGWWDICILVFYQTFRGSPRLVTDHTTISTFLTSSLERSHL